MTPGGFTKGRYTAKKIGGSNKYGTYGVFNLDTGEELKPRPANWTDACSIVTERDRRDPIVTPSLFFEPALPKTTDLPRINSVNGVATTQGDPF